LFFGYSFVANLRIDATMLPIPARRMDAAFSAYNAYLLYEVPFLYSHTSALAHIYNNYAVSLCSVCVDCDEVVFK
jgi:hypothetical protein